MAKQRAEAARGQIPATEKAVADTKAALDAIAPELAAASAKVQEVVAKLQPIHQALTAADTQMLAARAQWAVARRALKWPRPPTEQHQEIVAWLDELDSDKRLVVKFAGFATSRGSHSNRIAAVMTQLADLQQQLAASQAAEQVAASEKVKAVEAWLDTTRRLNNCKPRSRPLKSSSSLFRPPNR